MLGQPSTNGGAQFDGEPRVLMEYRDDVAVLRLFGEHDVASAEKLFAKITEHLGDTGVVVCLDNADFIDSNIVRTLYLANTTLARYGRHLVIQDGASAPVSRVLEIAGVHKHLHCADTLENALELARQPIR